MSRQIALDTVFLRPTPRLAHTDYSVGYHHNLIAELTDLDPKNPENGLAIARILNDWFEIDFNWGTHDGPINWGAVGRATDMGHAVYAADGSDERRPVTCPFTDVEEVYEFDPVKEYGLPGHRELVRYYEDIYRQRCEQFPNQLTTGGYYKTVISGAIAAFGWDMLLLAAADTNRFAEVLRRIGRYTKFYMDAWADTTEPVVIQHDDMVWTEGPFMHPDVYRQVIFPLYREMWVNLKKAGKKIIYCSDGTFDMFMPDLAAAGADGFLFEPTNNFDYAVENFGQTHCIVGSKVDCRTMAFKSWDDVKAEMDATFALAPKCRGLIFACGNHLPANIPGEIMKKYLAYLKANWAR
jgi:hypothetical protein